ncbi:phosphatase PAP2 family protein [Anaerovorax odorimutans]|uniref:phosphatase PAP2 family protein n=1 Tax=Anaerovorax odorimutans TaxID=109327 RepID=UPI0004182679|nr:phosphatase PAP2 family protein [Anaerovorax odorimutans]
MNKKKKLIVLMSFLVIFIIISYYISTNEFLSIDRIIQNKIYGLRFDFLTKILIFITYLGNWQTIVILCLLTLFFPFTRNRFSIPLIVSTLFSTVTYSLIKLYFARPRPDISFHLINQGGYSFPSGHSLNSMVFYGILIWLCRENIINNNISKFITGVLSILIFLIGFSRLYLGVHFPSDIIAGWSLGSFILLISINIFNKKYGNSKRGCKKTPQIENPLWS